MIKKIAAPTIDLLEEVKEYIHVVNDDSDALIQSEILSALAFAEKHTNSQFGTATYELYLPTLLNAQVLPKNPIQSIDKIEYMDNNEDYQLLESNLYYLYEENGLGMINFENTLSHKRHKNAIKITFKSGFEEIPEPVKTWICIRVMETFDDTEARTHKFTNNILDQYKISEF